MAQLGDSPSPDGEGEEWPSDFSDFDSFVQWRVDVLQRMQQFLPMAIITVANRASTKQSGRIHQWLALLLLCSRRYLGDVFFSGLSTILLRGIEHDNPGVRVLTWGLWDSIRQGEVASGRWVTFSASLRDRCTQALDALAIAIDDKEVNIPNEATLLSQTRAVLGIGTVLAEDLHLLLRAPGGDSFVE